MPGLAELPTSFAERKLLRWLFLFYCLFILYGSFIPFHFSDDPEFVAPSLFDSSRPLSTTASGDFRYLTLSAIFSFSSPSGFCGSAGNFPYACKVDSGESHSLEEFLDFCLV